MSINEVSSGRVLADDLGSRCVPPLRSEESRPIDRAVIGA